MPETQVSTRELKHSPSIVVGVSTEIPHSSNLTPISFGNWHIYFKEQQVEVTTQNTVQFGTPPIKQPSRWTGATSSVVKNWISVSRGRSLDGNLVIFNQHCCQSMLCPRKDNLIYSLYKLVYINCPDGHERGARARRIGPHCIVYILDSPGLWTETYLVNHYTMYSRPTTVNMHSDSH